jgi:ribosomal protein S1
VVLSVDPAAKKMSFSLKQAGPDPWKTVAERYATDMVVDGTVSRVVDFGAFVELEPGLEGLVHISELADHRVKSAGDVVKQGQAVRVRILEVDPKTRRVSLSLKRTEEVAAPTTPTEPTKSQKKKKQQLRGGLDWNW